MAYGFHPYFFKIAKFDSDGLKNSRKNHPARKPWLQHQNSLHDTVEEERENDQDTNDRHRHIHPRAASFPGALSGDLSENKQSKPSDCYRSLMRTSVTAERSSVSVTNRNKYRRYSTANCDSTDQCSQQ